ncbi:hypothetical protein HK100_002159 [Physocladia obscura]|uniref:Translationally-controlled tumor protein homolog n=1 Tax=Physocladia obscura TaxID=109957 RepID=A0AAD5SXU2_9FUNG|nr:hypothetical protein HK100_002159 [Physocladia obscura]
MPEIENLEFVDESVDPCLTCTSPCIDGHATYPPAIVKSIEGGPLINTMKPYARHIMFSAGSGKNWQRDISDELGPEAFLTKLEAGISAGKEKAKSLQGKESGRTMVSAIDRHPEGDSNGSELIETVLVTEVFLFPDFKTLRGVSATDAAAVAEEWVAGGAYALATSTVADVEIADLEYDAVIFICTHLKRDKRCGITGPLLMTEFNNAIEDLGLSSKVACYGISHIGGHKYAGNVIVYSQKFPQGLWYGRVSPCHVENIMKKTVVEGKVYKELFRGQGKGSVAMVIFEKLCFCRYFFTFFSSNHQTDSMLVFTDVISGDEILSDAYKLTEINDFLIEVDCQMIKIKEGAVDIGANASAEGGDEDDVAEDEVIVNNVVYSFRLQSSGFDKKGYMTYIKGYMKALKEHLTATNSPRLAEFEGKAKIAVKKILENFGDYEFYVGESMNPDGMVLLLNYREDGTTPYFTLWKDGLKGTKFPPVSQSPVSFAVGSISETIPSALILPSSVTFAKPRTVVLQAPSKPNNNSNNSNNNNQQQNTPVSRPRMPSASGNTRPTTLERSLSMGNNSTANNTNGNNNSSQPDRQLLPTPSSAQINPAVQPANQSPVAALGFMLKKAIEGQLSPQDKPRLIKSLADLPSQEFIELRDQVISSVGPGANTAQIDKVILDFRAAYPIVLNSPVTDSFFIQAKGGKCLKNTKVFLIIGSKAPRVDFRIIAEPSDPQFSLDFFPSFGTVSGGQRQEIKVNVTIKAPIPVKTVLCVEITRGIRHYILVKPISSREAGLLGLAPPQTAGVVGAPAVGPGQQTRPPRKLSQSGGANSRSVVSDVALGSANAADSNTPVSIMKAPTVNIAGSRQVTAGANIPASPTLRMDLGNARQASNLGQSQAQAQQGTGNFGRNPPSQSSQQQQIQFSQQQQQQQNVPPQRNPRGVGHQQQQTILSQQQQGSQQQQWQNPIIQQQNQNPIQQIFLDVTTDTIFPQAPHQNVPRQLAILRGILLSVPQALATAGIFRDKGSEAELKSIKLKVAKATSPAAVKTRDALAVATLIKSYFREMPTNGVQLCNEIPGQIIMETRDSQRAYAAVLRMHPQNRDLLEWVLDLIIATSNVENMNGMGVRALCTVWAPNLYGQTTAGGSNQADMMQFMNVSIQMVTFLKYLVEKRKTDLGV